MSVFQKTPMRSEWDVVDNIVSSSISFQSERKSILLLCKHVSFEPGATSVQIMLWYYPGLKCTFSKGLNVS